MVGASRVALVTGGGSGMGEATCHELGRRGLKVGVLDVNEQAAQRVTEDLRASGVHGRRRRRRRHRPRRRRAGVREGAQRVRSGVGPGNECGNVRARPVHRDHRAVLVENHRRQLDGHLSLLPSRDSGHGRREMGQDRDDLVVQRPARLAVRRPLRGVQGRGHHPHQIAGPRVRRAWHHRQQHPAVGHRNTDAAARHRRRDT